VKDSGSRGTARWRIIKSSKANLVLFSAGLALILLAGFWRLGVAPALKVVPTDIDLLRFYNGTLVERVRPPGQPPVGQQPAPMDVIIQEREFNPVRRSTSKVAVIEVDSAVINAADRRRLSEKKEFFAVNRKSAKQVKGKGADRDRSGYCLVFPFNTPEADLPVFDELTGKTQKAVFAGREKIYGVNALVFKVEYGWQTAAMPEGFPSRMTGAQLKSILSNPALPVDDSDSLKVEYKGDLSLEFLVEPVAGNLIGTRNAHSSVRLSVNNPASHPAFTQVITTLNYSETVASLREASAFAHDEIAKLRLQFLYLPVGLLTLGIACLLIGAFAGVKE